MLVASTNSFRGRDNAFAMRFDNSNTVLSRIFALSHLVHCEEFNMMAAFDCGSSGATGAIRELGPLAPAWHNARVTP
jgi:hypothetical protein